MSPDVSARLINFGAGPGKLPEVVLVEAQGALLNVNNSGVGILEMSHRSAPFDAIQQDAKNRIKSLIGFPDDKFEVLFMQGGGTLQFSAIPMNLLRKDSDSADYIITGNWSRQAFKEAKRLGYNVNAVEMVRRSDDGILSVMDLKDVKAAICPTARYIYYCDNETVDGIEFPSSSFLQDNLGLHSSTVFVSDMSSNFLSRPINLSKFSLIFATAQKNIGPAGVTVVIIRKDLFVESPKEELPLMLDYRVAVKNDSVYNTPPVFSIYVTGLVVKWIEAQFGTLESVDAFSKQKSNLIYQTIDGSNGLLVNTIPTIFRSRMNVIMQVKESGSEEALLQEAKQNGMIQLKGHRSVGGIRCSLYNAVTMEEARAFQSLLEKFLADLSS
jgi:phosphoserine aminotransferase